MKCDTLLWSHKAAWGGNASSTLSHSLVTPEVVTDEPQATLKTFYCWAGWERTRPLGDSHPKDSVVPSWEGSPGPHLGPRTIFAVLLVSKKSANEGSSFRKSLHLAREPSEPFHLCLFSPRVCTRVWGCTHTCMHTPVGVRGLCLASSSIALHLMFFRVSH